MRLLIPASAILLIASFALFLLTASYVPPEDSPFYTDPKLEALNAAFCREADRIFERHGHKRTPECLAEIEALRLNYHQQRMRHVRHVH